MLDWQNITTVLLDMDGTLLDLHFDTHFWLEHLPLRYSEKHAITLDAAKAELYPRFKAIEGQLEWYCTDHWSRELSLDVVELKHEVAHLISVLPHALTFLQALHAAGKRVVLLTNAHPASIKLKLAKTDIKEQFDRVITSHAAGYAKESPDFWPWLLQAEALQSGSTLLVDDNLRVLETASNFGIAHLLTMKCPDSAQGEQHTGRFPAIRDFTEIMPVSRGSSV